MIAKKLELDTNNGEGDVEVTREVVLESLLQNVKRNLITSHRVLRIEGRSCEFYLCTQPTNLPKDQQLESIVYGPYQSIVGADGVLSQVRTHALKGTYLIGDSRWVNDRWYDLGTQRINRGANIALFDGLELGQAMVTALGSGGLVRRGGISSNFCAWEISQRKRMRRITFFLVFVALIMFKFRLECLSMWYNTIYTIKDAIFNDACLMHDRENPLLTFQIHEKICRWFLV